MSDMCERNGKPVHYECIGAKKDNGDAIDEGESGVHRYGIDGKEQTEGDWNRQNSYINNGYSGHIDEKKMVPFSIIFIIVILSSVFFNILYSNKKCKK